MAAIVAPIHTRDTERRIAVLWIDESHCTHESYVQRVWLRKGTQGTVPTPPQRQSATLFEALPLCTQRFYGKRAERGTFKTFLAFLYQLYQRFTEALLLVRLDHGRLHKSRAVKRFLKQHHWMRRTPSSLENQ